MKDLQKRIDELEDELAELELHYAELENERVFWKDEYESVQEKLDELGEN